MRHWGQDNLLINLFSCILQVRKDDISTAFHPLRKSLSVAAPVSIPDIVAARTGKKCFPVSNVKMIDQEHSVYLRFHYNSYIILSNKKVKFI